MSPAFNLTLAMAQRFGAGRCKTYGQFNQGNSCWSCIDGTCSNALKFAYKRLVQPDGPNRQGVLLLSLLSSRQACRAI